jgi:menaquinone-9 beta-reductase
MGGACPHYEVIIAGAGPAGTATAARLLQRRGRPGRVLVLDRYRFPREKPCGGGLTGHADQVMAELELKLDVPHWPSPTAKVRFGSFERTVKLGAPVHVVRREEYDASLVAQVRARGVEVVEGEGVKEVDAGPEGVRILTSRGRQLTAEVLVGADGAASVVRKHLIGKKAIPHRLFKMEMDLPATAQADPAMIYDFTLMHRGLRGYLWVFPLPELGAGGEAEKALGRRVNVGLMHYPASRKGGSELTALLREGLREHGLELPPKGTRGWPVWGFHPRARVSAPRIVTVGDAAGIDALTGEGIAVAMEQAVVAGDAIDEALTLGDYGFRDYRRRLCRAVVGRELELDRWLARLLYGSRQWKDWLSLVLYDPDVLEMYAARVAGTEILADQKLRLYRALARHVWRWPSRRSSLAAAA